MNYHRTALQETVRILQVNTRDRKGGAEGSAWHLFTAYRARGHQSWLAVGEKYSYDRDVMEIPNDAYRSPWARLLLAAGRPWWPLERRVRLVVRAHRLLSRVVEPQRLLDWYRGVEDFHFPGTWHLLDLPPQRPEIVHCHNLHIDYFDLRVLPWLSHQVPVILNLRDAWLLTGHCAYFFDCERWKSGCGSCPYLKTYPALRRDATDYNWQRKRDLYARSRLYITAPSQWLMDQVHTSMLSGALYRVIPNAINLTIFKPGSQAEARRILGLPPHACIVLLTAQTPFKDYAMMEAALARLSPVDDAELLFVCLGTPGTPGAPAALGAGRIIWPGFEHSLQRMALYYRAADVFIHAAKDEAFGKTITEAMACGTPVVATAVGGIPEQVVHGENGLLVPSGDSVAMAAAVQQLLTQPALSSIMGRSAAHDAQRRFGLDQQVDAFLDFYQEVRDHFASHHPVTQAQSHDE